MRAAGPLLRAAVLSGGCAALLGAPLRAASPAPVAPLVAGLGAPEPSARERAARSLGALGSAAEGAVDPLVERLADADPFVAGAAADALSRVGPAAVAPLARALGDTRQPVRWGAAIALGKLGPAAGAALAPLVRAAADPDSDVRWTAVNALAAVGSPAPEVLAVLREARHDADEEVRRGASLALERLDPAGFARPPAWEETVATIERLVPILMRECKVPGVSIALVREGKVAWTRAWGVSDARTGQPVTPQTLFEAASMTKTVFAATVLALVEAGRLDLDAPLPAEVPEPLPAQAERARVTPRMVLTHTSGLPNWRKGGEERDGPLPLRFAPGSRFLYSGEGFFALQRFVERVTGEPLEPHARRTLFAPLGMESASYVWTEALDARLATGHGTDGKPLPRERYRHANAAYSLVTTAADHARLLAALAAPGGAAAAGLSPAAVARMLGRQVQVDAREPIERPGRARGGEVFWGLGWGLNATADGDVAYHSGANRTGFRCYSQVSPRRGTALVVLTNGLGGGELWTRLVAAAGDL